MRNADSIRNSMLPLLLLLQTASSGALLLRPTLAIRSSLRRPPTIVAQEGEAGGADDVKSQFEGLVQKVTGKEDYQFGDFFIKPTTQVVTEAVTNFTGKARSDRAQPSRRQRRRSHARLSRRVCRTTTSLATSPTRCSATPTRR